MFRKKFSQLTEKEFKEIYSVFWKRLYALAYNYLRDKVPAQEVVQDVFIRIWQKRNDLAHVNDLEAYLFTCLKHKIYEYYEKVARQERLKRYSLENFREEIHPVEEEITYKETLNLINQELDKLPVTTRTIFLMSKFERYSNKEIANQMHVSGKAVEYHITQALKKLRIRLSHISVYAAVVIFLR